MSEKIVILSALFSALVLANLCLLSPDVTKKAFARSTCSLAEIMWSSFADSAFERLQRNLPKTPTLLLSQNYLFHRIICFFEQKAEINSYCFLIFFALLLCDCLTYYSMALFHDLEKIPIFCDFLTRRYFLKITYKIPYIELLNLLS